MRFLPLASFLIGSLMLSVPVFAQKISGRVLRESGLGASHVTIQFKDKSNKVITNIDGTFTITAKKLPDTLVFSAAGYESYKVVISEATLKDPNFEVVLLSTRDKFLKDAPVKSGAFDLDKRSADSSGITGKKTPGYLETEEMAGRVAGVEISGEGYKRSSRSMGFSGMYTNASGEYLEGKKLFMYDSVPLKTDLAIYKSHLLTAGEVNDFNKWKMWEDFQETDFKKWSEHWSLYPKQRYTVQLQNKEHIAMIGRQVFLINKKTNDTVWSAVTDNTGKAELWAGMNGSDNEAEYIISTRGYQTISSPYSFANGVNKIELNSPCSVSNTVDIAFVVDATGSMSDEIDFLKLELEDVVRNTFVQHPDLDLRVGSVFYRDKGDEYLTRQIDFQTDLLKVLNFIKLQRAGGGGDTPESVDEALKMALDSLHWNETARSHILFLILDAPPHDSAKEKMFELIQKAASKGVRIVPVVCSGADKSTEFIMRSIALSTNGTYVFLTDNSGVGLSHIKPTTDVFNVEFLNSLLQRIVQQMVFANKCSDQQEVMSFKNIPLNVDKVKIYPNPTKGNISIESKAHLKEIFITDFTGKILMRLETNDKENKWSVNINAFPNATYLVKYITSDDRWGAEKVVLIH